MLICLVDPQVLQKRVNSLREAYLSTLQIKNIKLHIVTDIKVTINSLSVFGVRYLVGGRVILLQKKIFCRNRLSLRMCVNTYVRTCVRVCVCVCLRSSVFECYFSIASVHSAKIFAPQ